MDNQKQEFHALVACRFKELRSDAFESSTNIYSSVDFALTHEKLRDFGDTIFDVLAVPRLKIIADQFKETDVYRFSNDAILTIDKTIQFPGAAKFRLSYEINMADQSLRFESDYRITAAESSFNSDNWLRSKILSFSQDKFCEWLEVQLLDFVDSYHNRLAE